MIHVVNQLISLVLCCGISVTAFSQRSEMDAPSASTTVAIVNGTLVDGSGRAPLEDAVVIIEGASIKQVGARNKIKIPTRARMIDARGLVVAPGFIDPHNHSQSGLDADPAATTQVSQGITTVALGQDGGSAFPIGEYLTNRARSPVALNVLTFVGHATVRTKVMGKDTNRAATAAEVNEMAGLVEEAMRDGAFGLSTGLEYEIGKPATTDEVIELARVAGRFGGIYISHLRDEADDTFKAFAEALRIGQQGRLPIQISHIKLGSAGVWNRAGEAIKMIEAARRQGQDVTADCYPYEAWSSGIKVLVPSGNHTDRAAVARGLSDVGGAENVTIASCQAHPAYEFKTLEAIAQEQKQTPVEIYMQIVRDGGAGVIGHAMKEADIRAFYQQPWVMACSDGGIGMRHPRGAGTYPRVLGRYVRELGWLSIEAAIHKMTEAPARRFGLKDRGIVRAGMKADLVLFDPARVIDRSTFKEPGLIAEGVSRVFVNGTEVWRDGATTGNKPGMVLRHSNQHRPHTPRSTASGYEPKCRDC